MSAQEKFIFISGGSRGIGRAITLSQAKNGAVLFLNYLRDEESAEKTKSEAEKKGAKVHLLPGNIGDPEVIASLFKDIGQKTDRLDALVPNAVSGGLIETDSLKSFPNIDLMKKEFLNRSLGKRLGSPEDIAQVVAFLLSHHSDWIYGQTLIADGGYSLF